MKVFSMIDPLSIATHPNLIAHMADNRKPNRTWYLLHVDEHVILADTTWFVYENKWRHYQIEFPIRGLSWYMDGIKNMSFEIPIDTSLSSMIVHNRAIIDGEALMLGRVYDAEGRGSGYALTTLDRTERGLAKQYILSDELLFDHGLMDLFEKVAEQIKSRTA